MKRTLFASLALLLLLGGCAATGPKMATIKNQIPQIAADQGRIYFYREDSFVGAALKPEIQLNREVVGQSVPGGFFFVDRRPGSYEVKTTTEVSNSTTLTLEAGKQHYVKTSVSMGVLVGHVSPMIMHAEQAERDMAQLSYTGNPALLAAATPASNVPLNPQPVVAAAERPTVAAAPTVAAVTITPLQQSGAAAPAPLSPVKPAEGPAKLGTWSYEAERFANEQGCSSNHSGAWLIAKEDFAEHYEVRCADGGRFVAVCDKFSCRLPSAS